MKTRTSHLDAPRVKAAVAPVDFYRAELPGMPAPKRETGWVSGGLCPFHHDAHQGNFRLNLDTGAFTCFACGCKGQDVIAFTQARHSMTFIDALAAIAEAWGLR